MISSPAAVMPITIQGGAGDDTIYGDNQTAPTTGTETQDWIAGRSSGQSVAGGIRSIPAACR